MDYKYFENEGAYFRSRVEGGLVAWIDDVWFPSVGWTPYKGDSAARYFTATPIGEDQLPADARAASAATPAKPTPAPVKRESEHPNLIDRTSEAQGRAFQILSASPKPKVSKDPQ